MSTIAPIVIRSKSPHLLAFLHGTVDSTSPLRKLRGSDHIMRIIWSIVCEEWWDLHIDRFPTYSEGLISELLQPWRENTEGYSNYPESRKECAGCPVAVIGRNLSFPDPISVPMGMFVSQVTSDLYVNMMPFYLRDKDSLPDVLHGYWHLIEKCAHLCKETPNPSIAYLTIDERSVPVGSSQRRCGLHVESPGVMPLIQSLADPAEAQYAIQAPDGTFIPGAEHHWGGGQMMRDEYVDGGIFMASNIAGTTAVWNCRIDDVNGDFIGPHGDIERFRGLLGPCTRTLEAGELIWMTDRTPHESLPIPASAGSQRRQYFRLVVGQVSAWFADHSTPNPLGTVPPPDVRIVHGDKFTLYPALSPSWHCGTAQQLQDARRFRELTDQLYVHGIGHLGPRMFAYGITCLHDLALIRKKHKAQKPHEFFRWDANYSKNGKPLFNDFGSGYYDIPQLESLIFELANSLHAD